MLMTFKIFRFRFLFVIVFKIFIRKLELRCLCMFDKGPLWRILDHVKIITYINYRNVDIRI